MRMSHLEEAKYTNNKSHKLSWIRGLLKENLLPILEILDEIPKTNWQHWERWWIACEKEKIEILNLSKLTNMTPGGDGVNDITGEISKKISSSVKELHKQGKLKSFGFLIRNKIIIPKRKGKTYEEIYGKEKAIIAKKNVGKSSLGRKSRLNHFHTEETKIKISEKLKGNIPWNKGLTKDNDERIKKLGAKSGNSRRKLKL